MDDNVLMIDIPNISRSSNSENIKLEAESFECDKAWAKRFGLNYQVRSNLFSYTTGLLYIARVLSRSGYSVEYYNYEEKGLCSLKNRLKDKGIVLISSISAFFPIYSDIIDEIKSVEGEFRIIIGGFGPTYEPEKFLSIATDNTIAVMGGGEKRVFKAIDYFETGLLSEGLAIKKHIKPIEKEDLEQGQIPQPDYSILNNIANYRINVSTARGCPGSCSFCSGVPFWRKILLRKVDDVIKELDYLNKKLNKNTLIHFCDSVITYPEKRFLKLAEAISEEKYDLQFSCDVRADSINKNTSMALQNSNFKRICLGIEDCNNNILNLNYKGMTFDDNLKALNCLRKYTKSYLSGYWLVGLPGTTWRSIQQNQKAICKLIDENLIDHISISIYKPYPGCRFNKDEILINNDWNSFLEDMDFPMYHLPELSAAELASAMLSYKKAAINAYKKRLSMYE